MQEIWTISLHGNGATRRQVTALAEALQQELGGPEKVSTKSFFPDAPKGVDLSNNTGVTWTHPLTPEQLHDLNLTPPWPDVVISCRPEVSAIALGIKEASGGKTKVIHIQNPNGITGNYHFNLAAFDVLVRQPHEKIEGENVVSTKLALHGLTPKVFHEFRQAKLEAVKPLRGNLKAPILTVLVGGSDEHVTLQNEDFEKFGADLRQLAEQHQGTIIVVPSRRTKDEESDILKAALVDQKNVMFNPPLEYMGALALADRILITADSLSMVSESIATGRPCSIYDFHGVMRKHPLDKVFSPLVASGIVTHFPHMAAPSSSQPYDEMPSLAHIIHEKIWPQLSY